MLDEQTATDLLSRVISTIPSSDRHVNQEIVAMGAAMNNRSILEPALNLLEASRSQEEQVHYVQALTAEGLKSAWTPELRERFLRLVVDRVPHWKGGFTARARRDQMLHLATQLLDENERIKFSELLERSKQPTALIPKIDRPFVRNWTLDDLTPTLDRQLSEPRNLENGKALFSLTSCIACHSFQGEGGLGGPDLTNASGRYSALDLLENILNPNKVINEQYGLQVYMLKDGETFTGRTVNMAGDTVMVATNPNDPGGSEVRFQLNDLEKSVPSRTSLMPEGLLNTLTHEDILDLLAYIRQR